MVGIFQFAMLVITRWYISLGEKSPFSHGQFDLAMASFFILARRWATKADETLPEQPGGGESFKTTWIDRLL